MNPKSKTAPKGRPTPKRTNLRHLPSTMLRRYHGQDHFAPRSGIWDADGRLWHGHSKVTDRPARQRRNAATWAKEIAARRTRQAQEREDALVKDVRDKAMEVGGVALANAAEAAVKGKRMIVDVRGRRGRWA